MSKFRKAINEGLPTRPVVAQIEFVVGATVESAVVGSSISATEDAQRAFVARFASHFSRSRSHSADKTKSQPLGGRRYRVLARLRDDGTVTESISLLPGPSTSPDAPFDDAEIRYLDEQIAAYLGSTDGRVLPSDG